MFCSSVIAYIGLRLSVSDRGNRKNAGMKRGFYRAITPAEGMFLGGGRRSGRDMQRPGFTGSGLQRR